jgi:hypothetical protein
MNATHKLIKIDKRKINMREDQELEGGRGLSAFG